MLVMPNLPMKMDKIPDDPLAEYLAGKLWDWSALRHGMFSPPEFRRMCLHNLHQALHSEEGRAILNQYNHNEL